MVCKPLRAVWCVNRYSSRNSECDVRSYKILLCSCSSGQRIGLWALTFAILHNRWKKPRVYLEVKGNQLIHRWITSVFLFQSMVACKASQPTFLCPKRLQTRVAFISQYRTIVWVLIMFKVWTMYIYFGYFHFCSFSCSVYLRYFLQQGFRREKESMTWKSDIPGAPWRGLEPLMLTYFLGVYFESETNDPNICFILTLYIINIQIYVCYCAFWINPVNHTNRCLHMKSHCN